VATASRALNGSAESSLETRERISALAREVGYERNALASNLMRDFKKRRVATRREGIVLVCPVHPARLNPGGRAWVERILKGAERRALERGYQFDVAGLDEPGVTHRRLGGILQARGARGLILAPLPDAMELTGFPWHKFASVAIGPMLKEPALHQVFTNHYEGMAVCLEKLRARGCRRIGFVAHSVVVRRMRYLSRARYCHYSAHASEEQRVPIFEWVVPADLSRFLAWMAQ
jgi:LacI family transcriptional regulator